MSNPSQGTPKARILALVEDQPEDSSYDEILHELAFVRMVERGIADADAGRVVPHEEVKRRFDAWSR
jgi:predicted transcriptional regulator